MKTKVQFLNQCNFLRSKENYEESKVVIVGAPLDQTTSFRPGTRIGPRRIRELSYGLEDYSPYLDDSLNEKNFYDLGDIELPFGNLNKSLEMIEQTAQQILEDGKIPFFIGGEHLITYPVIKQVVSKYPKLKVLHFDAHADLRDSFFGERLSHATVLRRVCECIEDKHLYQFGIRSGVKEEFDFAKDHANTFLIDVKEPFLKVLEELKSFPIYITFDIDVIDPAYAPGTGTQEPGGCTSKEVFEIIKTFRELEIVGFDLVEVSPPLDFSERTSLLAAKIIRELLICIA
ncbi:agmatinase [Pseudothermotoga sp. U03pept]|uniref:agmatinase n=1 Tax=Pseudothermotoga sp. U03pept TaxID=3447012 RepID=UPI003F118413